MLYGFPIEISTVQEIIQRIDFIRRQNGLNQESLAKVLGISQPAVSKYLKDRIPPAETLFNLAQLGNTTIEWILCGQKNYFYEAQNDRVSEPDTAYGNDLDIGLARKIARLAPTSKKVLLELLELIEK